MSVSNRCGLCHKVIRDYEDHTFSESLNVFVCASLECQADVLLRAHAKEVDPETGKPRGIGGDDPILFFEHLAMRKRREIYPLTDQSNGVVDPSIEQGMYNRQHPQGRKVNSDEQRSRNGASYYR